MRFLIWSIEHTAWWCADRCGYTLELPLAGRYDADEAREIVKDANIVKVNECLVPAEAVGDKPRRKRNTDDDVGFDQTGRPFMLGAEAGAQSDAIIDHPDAKPVLVVATHGDALGVRVFGPPSVDTADMLDHVAATYRQAVNGEQREAAVTRVWIVWQRGEVVRVCRGPESADAWATHVRHQRPEATYGKVDVLCYRVERHAPDQYFAKVKRQK